MMETGHSRSQSTKKATKLQRGDTPSTSGQPPSRVHRLDGVILKVAEALPNDNDLRRLGLELGVKYPDINRALATNWAGGEKTSNGNVMMLHNWAMTVKASKQLPTLRAALKKVGLLEVEETCLPSSPAGDHEGMPDEILRLRQQLKRRYRKIYSKVKTSPVDPESWTWLQHIYVSLVMKLGQRGDREEPMDYEGLFKFIKTETEEGFVTRLSFIGEAGVGKSTLFAKIALDWAEGKILQEIDLLFLESFRVIKDSQYFGDIVMNHFPDDIEISGAQVDEYIRKNQRKVLLLLDGLDEARIDIKKSNRNNALVSIVRGERFIDTPVFITTRPFGADQIKSVQTIRYQYTFIQVKGFTPENMSKYINQFFQEDRDSASTLLQLVKSNEVVAEDMAPIPIFCCMLCNIWKTPSRRESLLKMKTLPQLFKLIVFSLQEQYCSKHSDVEEGFEFHMKKAVESLEEVARVAFHGLLVKQLIFDEKVIGSEAGMIACEIGILSREQRLPPRRIKQNQGKQFIHEFSFPHKLLQEYTSSFYLLSLFRDDRPGFNRILADKLLKDYKEFRYVLYFTAAHGGEVGKSLMEALCQRVDDLDFIIQVAFECDDTGATIEPVSNLLNMKSYLELKHPFTTYFFTLETLGEEVMRKGSSIVQPLGIRNSIKAMSSSSHVHVAALGLFTLQNLRSLDILDVDDEDFYKGMCDAASQSKIAELTQMDMDLGPAASSHYARGVFSMPHLRSLRLDSTGLSDEFYSVMAAEASTSKIEELTQMGMNLGPAASSHFARGVFSMPQLQSLRLDSTGLSDEFYSVMAAEASTSKIEELTQMGMNLGPAASSHFARGVFSMPLLRSLRLDSAGLSDEFYSVMAAEASTSKIEELTQMGMNLGPAASSHFARGVFSMPLLRSLRLDSTGLSDEFYSVMAVEASISKIEELTQMGMNLGPAASSHFARGVFSMPQLQSLRLDSTGLSDEFYSVMAAEASTSKIEELTQMGMNLGPAASSHFARGVFSMPQLQSLRLDSTGLSDEFYSVMAAEASTSKIEELTQMGMNLGPAASSHFARGVFSMPQLQSLRLDSTGLSDEFYSVMAAEASTSKIEELTQMGMNLGPAASSHFARGVFSMPQLQSLRLDSTGLSDEFYSVMAAEASTSKIEELTQMGMNLGPAASSHFARGVFSMPQLQSLRLDSTGLSDEFYSVMAAEASTSKIEELTQMGMNLGPAASSHFARGVFSMPQLQSLRLDSTGLSDEFYSVMAAEASTSKIQTLSMRYIDVTRRSLHAILSLPRLQSLSLTQINSIEIDDEQTLSPQSSSVVELNVDRKHITNLWKLGLHTSCSRVRKLTLHWGNQEDVSSDIVSMACYPFNLLTELHIDGSINGSETLDPASFCNAVITSCPRLTKLSITRVKLRNEKATEIIQSMNTHPHLTHIQMTRCSTNRDLDPMIAEVNSEGKLTVDVVHGLSCFPQIEGKFTFHTAPQENSDSFLRSLTVCQRSQVRTSPSADHQQTSSTPGTDDISDIFENQLSVSTPLNQEQPPTTTSPSADHHQPQTIDHVQQDLPCKSTSDGTIPEGSYAYPPTALTRTSHYVDSGGKDLSIPSYGFILSIPPGALEEGSCEWITCEALPSLPNDIKLKSDELIVSPGFYCYPLGLHFKKPIKLIIPHCGVFNYPSRVRTVLISTGSQNTGEVLRTPLTQDACTVKHRHFEVFLQHFSGGHVVVLYDQLVVKGKRMLCMPYLPKIMPTTRKPVMEFCLRNKPHDPALREARRIDVIQHVKDFEDEIYVKYKDLEVNCLLDEDEPNTKKIISYGVLFSKPKHQEYFQLNLKGKANDATVTLELLQDKKKLQEIMFHTIYAGVASSAVDPEDHSKPASLQESCSASRPTTRSRKRKAPFTQPTVTDNISGILEKQVQTSRTSPDHHRTSHIPTPGVASSAVDPKEESKPPRAISALEYFQLSREISKNGYYLVGLHLRQTYTQLKTILQENSNNYAEALMDVFTTWNFKQKVEETNTREDLADVLQKSELDALADKLSRGCLASK